MISFRAVLLNRLNTFTWHFLLLFSLLTLLAHPPYCQTRSKLNETTKSVESSHPSQPSHNFPRSKAHSIIQSPIYNPFFYLNSSPSQSVFQEHASAKLKRFLTLLEGAEAENQLG